MHVPFLASGASPTLHACPNNCPLCPCLQAARAASQLSALIRQPPSKVAIESGALLIAQVHSPATDVEGQVLQVLDGLGAEALRRMQAQGVQTAAQVQQHSVFLGAA